MKPGRIALTTALLIAFIVMGSLKFRYYTVAKACDPVQIGLPADAPAQLVAILRFECAETFPGIPQSERARFALEFGYPSLLFGHTPEDEIFSLLDDISQKGDMGFFVSDPNILNLLNERSLDPRVSRFIDFVRAANFQYIDEKDPNINERFLVALPIWENPTNMRRLDDWCSTNACPKTTTICSKDFGLVDKLALVRGQMSFQRAYSLCPLTFDWIFALRRAGIVDTICDTAFQANNIMNGTKEIGEPCFPEHFSYSESTTSSPGDVVLFVRNAHKTRKLFTISEQNMKKINEYYPDIYDFLSRHRGE